MNLKELDSLTMDYKGFQFHLEATAGTLRLWKSWGRMSGTQWAYTDTESPDTIRISPDRWNLKQMKALKYKLPEGTPDRWSKVDENQWLAERGVVRGHMKENPMEEMSEREWLAAGREPWVSEVISTTLSDVDYGAYRIDRLEIIKTHSVGYRTAKYVKRSTYEYEVLRQTCSHEPLWFTSWGPYDSLVHARRVAVKLQDLDRQKDAL